MKTLAILGASGHGRVVADTALSSGWDQVVFFDDAWPKFSQNSFIQVLGGSDDLIATSDRYQGVAVAIGSNRVRLKKIKLFLAAGLYLPVLIHQRAYVAQNVLSAPGCLIFAGAIVQPGCSLGMGCIVNTAASIDHDCKIGDCAHISPGARLAGSVEIGECVWIGLGATVNQCLTIGQHVLVGAGATVIDSVANHLTVVGNPARSIPKV